MRPNQDKTPDPGWNYPVEAPRGVARTNTPTTPAVPRPARGWTAYLADPRTAVLLFLSSALVIGGGRKGLQAIRARRLVAAISGSNPDPADVEAAAEHGRAGLPELFRLVGNADRPEVRDAAGRALARLWRADELIVEEEKAIVLRGYSATWRARRTYPRGLHVPIPITVHFGVSFLGDGPRTVNRDQLVWSYRITGTERAGPSEWTEPRLGSQSATFEIFPDDFANLGPHRLALQARVKTVNLTDTWELDLPHIPFSFEFDPNLTVAALLTLPDETRAARMAAAVRLAADDSSEQAAESFLALNHDLVIRNSPSLVLTSPLPTDLAHHLAVEFEGIPGVWQARSVVLPAASLPKVGSLAIGLGAIRDFPANAIDRPGPQRVRAILTADPSLGWTNPDVRSIWPGTLTTDWVEVRVIRR